MTEDEVIGVLIPETFYGVGLYYNDFTQVTDEEVLVCLKRLRQRDISLAGVSKNS